MSDMSRKDINKFWQSGIKKEAARYMNKPKSPSSNKWMTPEEFSMFAPAPKKGKR